VAGLSRIRVAAFNRIDWPDSAEFRKARTQEKRKIRLIDLERFVEMWTECYPRLEDAAKRKLSLQPIWFLAPME
jgi:restriction system protein